jgi:nucleoside-diphosphate-sugar epimerase
MDKILVTGGLGYVGGHLLKRLQNGPNKVSLLVREGELDHPLNKNFQLLTIDELELKAKEEQFNIVINLAGKYSFDHQTVGVNELLSSNVVFPIRVAAAISGSGTRVHWVQASTFMQNFKGLDRKPSCFYASTKQTVEDLLGYFENDSFHVTSLVLPHIFGEEDKREKLINLFVRSATSGNMIQLSSGSQAMDLVHVEDIVNALEMVIKTDGLSGRWQISSGRLIRVAEIAEFVNLNSQNGIRFQFDPTRDRPFDCYELWINAPALPNWRPEKELFSWLADQLKSPDPSFKPSSKNLGVV